MSACWKWNGPRDKHGYGTKMISYRRHFIHRLAWAWANGSWDEDGPYIPFGMGVLHRCDNPPCCNPDHLFLGTQADNVADMLSKKPHYHSARTHCPSGHPYSGDNLKVRRDGSRICRACHRRDGQSRYWRQKQ